MKAISMRSTMMKLLAGTMTIAAIPAAAQVQDVDIAVVVMDRGDSARWLEKGISARIADVERRIVSGGKQVRAVRVRPDDQQREFKRDEGLDLPTSMETVNGSTRVAREVTITSGFMGRYRLVGDRLQLSVRRTWIDKWRKKKGFRYPFMINAISDGRTYALDAPSVVQLNRSVETIKGRMAIMYVAASGHLDAAMARRPERRRMMPRPVR